MPGIFVLLVMSVARSAANCELQGRGDVTLALVLFEDCNRVMCTHVVSQHREDCLLRATNLGLGLSITSASSLTPTRTRSGSIALPWRHSKI